MSDEDNGKLPFGRWLLKLLVTKFLTPVLCAAIAAAGAAWVAWHQARASAEQEQQQEEVLRDLLRDFVAREAAERVEADPTAEVDPDALADEFIVQVQEQGQEVRPTGPGEPLVLPEGHPSWRELADKVKADRPWVQQQAKAQVDTWAKGRATKK